MLQLISDHGSTISTGFFQNSLNTHSLSKCLRYLRNVIHVDAQVAALDANSSSYKLLSEMAERKKQIAFKGQIYIPVKWSDASLWGFIKLENTASPLSTVQIKKSVQAVHDILERNLEKDGDKESLDDQSLMILASTVENGHRVSTSLFQDKKFTAFINISEWITQDQAFTLKSLREFNDSLLFVPELMELSPQQRTVLALYALLPSDMKRSSLVVATRLSADDLEIALKGEANFIKAFENNTINGDIHDDDNILGI